MHYELWEFRSRSLVNTYATQDEALAIVRRLLSSGWDATDLGLGCEWDEGEPESAELPPPLNGTELAARARAAQVDETSLSA